MQLTNLEPEGATERLAALVEEALPVFEAAADDLALWTVLLGARPAGHETGFRWRRCGWRPSAASSTPAGSVSRDRS